MAIQQTKSLTDSQTEKLVTLLKSIESAESARDAVWLDEEGRDEIREIREVIEE